MNMKYYFHTLQWEYLEMAELDMIADYSFNNGISIRISTGQETESNILMPYEMNVQHPIKGRTRIGHLDKYMINDIMRTLDNEIINELNNLKTNEKNDCI